MLEMKYIIIAIAWVATAVCVCVAVKKSDSTTPMWGLILPAIITEELL